MAVALGDEPERRAQLLGVLVEVLGEVRGLVRAQRPAVLAQVEGVEGVAALGPPVGGAGLEEVVAEPVDVQHRPARRRARRSGRPGSRRPRPRRRGRGRASRGGTARRGRRSERASLEGGSGGHVEHSHPPAAAEWAGVRAPTTRPPAALRGALLRRGRGLPRRRARLGAAAGARRARARGADQWGIVGGHVEPGRTGPPRCGASWSRRPGWRCRTARSRSGTTATTRPRRRPAGLRNHWQLWVGRADLTDADIVLGEGRQIVFVDPPGSASSTWPRPRPTSCRGSWPPRPTAASPPCEVSAGRCPSGSRGRRS